MAAVDAVRPPASECTALYDAVPPWDKVRARLAHSAEGSFVTGRICRCRNGVLSLPRPAPPQTFIPFTGAHAGPAPVVSRSPARPPTRLPSDAAAHSLVSAAAAAPRSPAVARSPARPPSRRRRKYSISFIRVRPRESVVSPTVRHCRRGPRVLPSLTEGVTSYNFRVDARGRTIFMGWYGFGRRFLTRFHTRTPMSSL